MTSKLLIVSAVFEASIGVALLASPVVPVTVLLGAVLDAPAALVLCRVTGGALLSLGIACWCARHDVLARSTQGIVAAMFVYNVATASAFAFGGLVYRLAGIGLWPTAVLHLAMAAWCVATLRSGMRSRR